MRRWRASVIALGLAACPAAGAERRAVLAQIDLPHNYYFREMYLPQLTSGPGSLCFTPDGQALIYSMQGSLWRQRLDSDQAEQLTSGPGYDYQPDVANDGRRVVFVRYLADAMELMQMDLASGSVTALTANRAVNVEPRWSPDGAHIAWVSTFGSGHLHIFAGIVAGDALTGGALWPERRSATPRYYYSAFDHELSPSWSRDGRELIYIGNPDIVYGTGDLWRRGVDSNAAPQLLHHEETTWRARPDWSPDGKRVVYSSYAGRQWHQLYMTPASPGGDPTPISYGEYDVTGAHWSPDATKIAFITNQNGNTQIGLQEMPGGQRRLLEIARKRFRVPMGRLDLRLHDAAGKPLAARVAIVASDGRTYGPDNAWIRSDDGYDRERAQFETHYFHASGRALADVPAGLAHLTVWRGPEFKIARRDVVVRANDTVKVAVAMRRLTLPPAWAERWRSGDLHVHMNYGGAYRDTPQRLAEQAAAEDLSLVFDLIVNKEQRVPDIDYFSTKPDVASTSSVLLSHGQEFHTSYWGHLGLLGLRDHYLLPGYVGYNNTSAASLYPSNATVADLAHAQGALVGYVHPFDQQPDPVNDAALTNELPVDAALGKIDYYEVVGFSDHRASAAVWYRLLNCGIRLPAAAGTDAMANFASLRGPVGLNRVYVSAGPSTLRAETRLAAWLAGLKAGRTMATNGPLVSLEVQGREPGAEIVLGANRQEIHYRGFLRSTVAIEHLELVYNGSVVRRIELATGRTSADLDGVLRVDAPGWLLLRAWNEHADPDVFDIYPYATTNPVFFTRAGRQTHCGPDADYLLAWLERLRVSADAHSAYNNEQEKQTILGQISAARSIVAQRR